MLSSVKAPRLTGDSVRRNMCGSVSIDTLNFSLSAAWDPNSAF